MPTLNTNTMAQKRGKEEKKKSDKTAPSKTPKEKKLDKAAKKKDKKTNID